MILPTYSVVPVIIVHPLIRLIRVQTKTRQVIGPGLRFCRAKGQKLAMCHNRASAVRLCFRATPRRRGMVGSLAFREENSRRYAQCPDFCSAAIVASCSGDKVCAPCERVFGRLPRFGQPVARGAGCAAMRVLGSPAGCSDRGSLLKPGLPAAAQTGPSAPGAL